MNTRSIYKDQVFQLLKSHASRLVHNDAEMRLLQDKIEYITMDDFSDTSEVDRKYPHIMNLLIKKDIISAKEYIRASKKNLSIYEISVLP